MTAVPFKSTSQLKLELLANVRSHWSHHKHCKVTWHPDAARPSQSLLYKKHFWPCGKHSAVARSLIRAMETRFLQTSRLQPSGVIDKNNFWSSVADLRRLGGAGDRSKSGPLHGTFTLPFHLGVHAAWRQSACLVWDYQYLWARCFLDIFITFALHQCWNLAQAAVPVLPEVPHWLESARWLASLLSKRQSSPIFSTERSEYPLLGKSPNTTRASNKQNNWRLGN